MTDPAEVRAEGRRLLADAEHARHNGGPMAYSERPVAVDDFLCYLSRHADVLLADPAPVGLTPDERLFISYVREGQDSVEARLLAIIDRLSAAPEDDRERVPEGWRVEWRVVDVTDEGNHTYTGEAVPTLVPKEG